MTRSGRRPGDSGTRERIAVAARETFGELGFEGATIREIAGRAGVDAALVHHFFGNKQRLFLSVMNLPFDAREIRERLLRPGPKGVGPRFVRFFLGVWDDQPAVRMILTGIVRSATTDPAAAALLREFLGRQGLFEVIAQIAVDRPDLRTTLVGSQLIGLAMGRYIIGIEPLTSMPAEAIVAAIGPTIERYLLGDIDGPS